MVYTKFCGYLPRSCMYLTYRLFVSIYNKNSVWKWRSSEWRRNVCSCVTAWRDLDTLLNTV